MMTFNAEDTFKPFADAASTWKDMMENFTGSFKGADKAFKFQPMGGMDQAGKGMEALFNFMPMDETAKKDMKEKLSQACQSCEKVYDKYVAVASDLTREGIQMNQAWIKGEATDTPALYDLTMSALKEMSECFADCLTDTPFESLKSLDKALKQSISSFSDEEQTIKSFIAELITLNNKIGKLCTSAAKESTEAISKKKKENTAAIEALAKMANTIAETQKRLGKLASLPEPAITKFNETIDNLAELSRKQLDVIQAGMQIPANLYFAAIDTTGEIEIGIKEMFDDAQTISTEHFFTRWMENIENLTRNTVEKSEIEQTIPQFISVYADMLQTARAHFNQYLILPYATYDELSKLEKKIKKPAPKSKTKAD